MTPPNPLTELADRVEKSTGRDRALGHEILLACGWRKTCVGHFCGPIYHWSTPDAKISYPEDRLPCPTASLDAAMMLAVEKWWLKFDRFLMSDDPTRYGPMPKTWRVWLNRYVGDLEGGGPCYQQKILATGPTPEIALTAGWLRARAATEAIPHGR